MERLMLVSSLVLLVHGAPAPLIENNKEDIIFANEFMAKFGYLDVGGTTSKSLVRVEIAIKDVQRYGNIAQTGQLDNTTLQLMKSPRCGLPDILPSGRRKRFILGSSTGWRKRTITYFVANWSPQIGQNSVRSELQLAFTYWGKYGRLDFLESTSPDADIIVTFGTGYHGDPYSFDGPGRTLAHAFLPGSYEFAGDIHFDEDETWKIRPGAFEEGMDFFTVAVHEIGHSLGLSHSDQPGSIMNPYYRQSDSRSFSLGHDDILAMYELYIKNPVDGGNNSWDDEDETTRRTSPETPRTTTTTQMPVQTTTERPVETTTKSPVQTTTSQQDVTSISDVETVEVHKTHDCTHGLPDAVACRAPETPGPVPRPTTHKPTPVTEHPDACEGHFSAVANIRGELFIFKDMYMWRLSGPGSVERGYPVTIHRMFYKLPQTVETIDAVYERNTDNNIILFTGNNYWIHDGNEIVNSPRPLSDYGLPSYVKKVDAVMVWPQSTKTLIFSGNEFWEFNETTRTLDSPYAKFIQQLQGVPSSLDSAMTWTDGKTYFFKDNLYWAFNNTLQKTESHYPQQAPQYWLGCC